MPMIFFVPFHPRYSGLAKRCAEDEEKQAQNCGPSHQARRPFQPGKNTLAHHGTSFWFSAMRASRLAMTLCAWPTFLMEARSGDPVTASMHCSASAPVS